MPQRRHRRRATNPPLACHVCDTVTADYTVATCKAEIRGQVCITLAFICSACMDRARAGERLKIELEKLYPGYGDEVQSPA